MKKTTQTLLTVLSVILLLVFTTSPRARTNPNLALPVPGELIGQIRWKKDMGLIPIGPGSAQASTSACSAFFIFAIDLVEDKVIAYSRASTSQPKEEEEYYVCNYSMQVRIDTKVGFLPGMGDGLLPKIGPPPYYRWTRLPYYVTDQWVGGTNSRPSAGWERGFDRGDAKADSTSMFLRYQMIYVYGGDQLKPTLDSSSEKGASPILRASSFAGVWHAKLGEGALELIFQQTGKQVTGQVKLNSADVGVIREGIVVGNTLRFKIVRVGRPLPNGLNLPDEYVGTGELVMDEGGKSFTGNVLGTATSGTFVGR